MSDHQSYDFLLPRPISAEPGMEAIDHAYNMDEAQAVDALMAAVQLDTGTQQQIEQRARKLVQEVRSRQGDRGLLDAFMQQYDLSSEEGVILMCLAEALLRIPDDDTAEKLIADKLGDANWESHLGKSSSVLVNASTWGLMLTGKLVALPDSTKTSFKSTLKRLINRSGEPVVRTAIRQAMRIMGHQYVMGRTVDEALDRSQKKKNQGYRYSFDMLGEAALTHEDAERYMESYRAGILAIGSRKHAGDVFAAPSISVKLSALHPRFEFGQRERVVHELTPKLLELAQLAMANRMALTVDTEEADRLMLTLDVFSGVILDPSLAGWNGFGIALQTYQQRAPEVIDFLAALSAKSGQRIPVRLVKGAYWDAEIKHAQVEGFEGYPVYTRKANTDVSYIACAKKILALREAFYPQFATHNAQTIATVTELAGDRLDYEFQRLHGMGRELYDIVMTGAGFRHACRVYAPVGSHEDLLPYLVRRLLENGSNTSFVNRIVDDELPVEKVVENPIQKVAATEVASHPSIPLPSALYGTERVNSSGMNLANGTEVFALATRMQAFAKTRWDVEPMLARKLGAHAGPTKDNINPGRLDDTIGTVRQTSAEELEGAIEDARAFTLQWDETPGSERAALLEAAADLMEADFAEYMALCCREAGKTAHDAIAEIREAVDFLRYYALQARKNFDSPIALPGPTGERNELSLHGKGLFVCISPWNFPLAIFVGQVSAALAAGNTVLAKPADQTPAIAALAIRTLHRAGIPRAAVQLVPGRGSVVGAKLTSDPRVDGVALTGSMDTARLINRSLAARDDSSLAVMIAETGGQNAMLVDSSALPEQVVQDVIRSAFHSAGQRCSALRVLFVQDDVADRIMTLLAGAMQELVIGDPRWLSTDVGPVIDGGALEELSAHAEKMEKDFRLVARAPLGPGLSGHYLAPCAFEIDSINTLKQEVFGPILHIVRYRARDLDKIIDEINSTGYGLTLGIHSRIDHTQQYIAKRVLAGNCYINRNMIGAVVGVQPFGGERLSGTGPKAGGPHYMFRFATERTLTVNTAAVGGNTVLLDLDD